MKFKPHELVFETVDRKIRVYHEDPGSPMHMYRVTERRAGRWRLSRSTFSMEAAVYIALQMQGTRP